MPQKTPLRHHLSPDWRRQVENVGQAAARLWATPLHAHVDRVVALLDGPTAEMIRTDQPGPRRPARPVSPFRLKN